MFRQAHSKGVNGSDSCVKAYADIDDHLNYWVATLLAHSRDVNYSCRDGCCAQVPSRWLPAFPRGGWVELHNETVLVSFGPKVPSTGDECCLGHLQLVGLQMRRLVAIFAIVPRDRDCTPCSSPSDVGSLKGC